MNEILEIYFLNIRENRKLFHNSLGILINKPELCSAFKFS